jgi:hypothetical protein
MLIWTAGIGSAVQQDDQHQIADDKLNALFRIINDGIVNDPADETATTAASPGEPALPEHPQKAVQASYLKLFLRDGKSRRSVAITDSTVLQSVGEYLRLLHSRPGGANTALPAGLKLDIATDKKIYRVGQPVNFTMAMRNAGTKPLALNFPSSQNFDIAISLGSKLVWQWSHDRMFGQIFRTVKLAPGEKRTFTAAWAQTDNKGARVRPGTYAVKGSLAATGRPAFPPLTIKIEK